MVKCQNKKCISDKDVVIPDNEVIGEDIKKDKERFSVSKSGIEIIHLKATSLTRRNKLRYPSN